MNGKHLLVKKAFTYDLPKEKRKKIAGVQFDEVKGMWVLKSSNQALVKSEISSEVIKSTKKADNETGEDQKGE